MKRDFVLGIDTSNYKTSVALINRNEVLCDIRKFLDVRDGELGLRQSEALFQHINNLPLLIKQFGNDYSDRISAVAYSGTPRPVEGSYMPCFLAGKSLAESISSLYGIPAFEFSHQEGHIEAIRYDSGIGHTQDFIGCHFSGGTCEILNVKQNSDPFYITELIGGTKDISFGQLLDRIGVEMGLQFPCGEALDKIAANTNSVSSVLSKVKVTDGMINLSGIETQIKRAIPHSDRNMLIAEVFSKISDAIINMLRYSINATGITEILVSGGVSSSSVIREEVTHALDDCRIHFGDSNMSSDNAVGIALLGGRKIWD